MLLIYVRQLPDIAGLSLSSCQDDVVLLALSHQRQVAN